MAGQAYATHKLPEHCVEFEPESMFLTLILNGLTRQLTPKRNVPLHFQVHHWEHVVKTVN